MTEEVRTQRDGAPSLTLGKVMYVLPWNFLDQELIPDVSLASKRLIKESKRRGFCFDDSKLKNHFIREKLSVTRDQVDYKLELLKKKLNKRASNKQDV
jgi:hypothetical protein